MIEASKQRLYSIDGGRCDTMGASEVLHLRHQGVYLERAPGLNILKH